MHGVALESIQSLLWRAMTYICTAVVTTQPRRCQLQIRHFIFSPTFSISFLSYIHKYINHHLIKQTIISKVFLVLGRKMLIKQGGFLKQIKKWEA